MDHKYNNYKDDSSIASQKQFVQHNLQHTSIILIYGRLFTRVFEI